MNIEATVETLEFIREATFPTGTVAYGLPNPKDHDRFCTMTAYNGLQALLSRQGINMLSGGSATPDHSMIFDVAGEHFNIFVVPDNQIEIVKATTAIVTLAAKALPAAASMKPLRICLFRQVRDTLTMWQKMEKKS